MTRAIAWPAAMALALATLSGCTTTAAPAGEHPEARAFDAAINADAAVDAALARSQARGTRVLLVFGANWCHDSRALAGWLSTPRFAALLDARFETVFINVGMPQTDDGHNLHLASRFGLETMSGTPALLVVRPDGSSVNLTTAGSWRNAASRSEEAIFTELTALADQK